ncbi:MAG TPA: putative collagen-binding domain-containing protein, partial [Nitrospira sp.]|nr:putative collagen-binding domain-containing protein [Nitrospira sp.]
AHLNTQGAHDMARLNAFVRSIAWYRLVPSGLDGMKTIVTAGGSQSVLADYVAAAASPDGTLLVAYVPPDHTGPITIDMTVMSGQTQARWFNPATAEYTLIGTSLANTSTHAFVPPGNNGTGFNDWVLLLERQ